MRRVQGERVPSVPCRRTCDELNRVALAFEGLVVGRDEAGDLAAPPQRDVHLGEEPQLDGGKAREDRLVHLDTVPQQQAQVCNRRGMDKRQPMHEMGRRTSKNGRKRPDAMRLSGSPSFSRSWREKRLARRLVSLSTFSFPFVDPAERRQSLDGTVA